KLQLTGEPFPIGEQVGYNPVTGRAMFSASQTGVLVFLSTNAPNTQLAWFDRGGKQLGIVGGPAVNSTLRLSPDEKRLAISRLDPQTGTADVWLIDLARNNPSRFTFDPANDGGPVWSPDGSRIVFFSTREGVSNIYQKVSNGTGTDQILFKSNQSAGPHDWSPDGKFILFSMVSSKTGPDLWILPLSGDQKPIPF